MPEFEVGQRVRCKIDMWSDCSNEGMGMQLYARKDDEVIVREVVGEYLYVSHEQVTNRSFSVKPEEVE